MAAVNSGEFIFARYLRSFFSRTSAGVPTSDHFKPASAASSRVAGVAAGMSIGCTRRKCKGLLRGPNGTESGVLATGPCSTSCGNRVGRSDTTLLSAFSASAALIAALTCCNSFAHPASSAEASRQASFATAVTVPQHDSLVSAQFLNGASHSDKQSRRCLRLAVNLKRCSCIPCRSNSTLPLNVMISFAITDVWWRCGAANDFLRGGVARTACCNSRNFDSSVLLRPDVGSNQPQRRNDRCALIEARGMG